MGHIYQLASRVLVWLGPESNNSNLALSTLKYLGTQVEVTRGFHFVPSPNCTEFEWFHSTMSRMTLPYDDDTWQAINDLLGSSWFERLWIIQEIQLANRNSILLCGTDEIPWSLFRRAITFLVSAHHNISLNPSSINFRERSLLAYTLSFHEPGQPLPVLLASSSASQSTKSVDKIYGILGIAPKTIRDCIRPDYNLSLEEVFTDVFIKHVNLVHRLELFPPNETQNSTQTISWVRGWWSVTFPLWYNAGGFASGFAAAQISYHIPKTLQVAGVQCSTISTVWDSCFDTESDILNLISSGFSDNLYNNTYVTGETLLEAYSWTLSLGVLRDQGYDFFPSLQEFNEFIVVQTAQSEEGRGLLDQRSYLLQHLRGHKFFTTREGYIGVGPALSLEG